MRYSLGDACGHSCGEQCTMQILGEQRQAHPNAQRPCGIVVELQNTGMR